MTTSQNSHSTRKENAKNICILPVCATSLADRCKLFLQVRFIEERDRPAPRSPYRLHYLVHIED